MALHGCSRAQQGDSTYSLTQQPASEVVDLPRPPDASLGNGKLSPDGTRFAYEVGPTDGSTQIWSLDLESGDAGPLTSGPGRRVSLAWSPGGDRIAYWITGRGGTPELEGIWFVGLDDGGERRVFRSEYEIGFAHSPRWAGPDSILFDHWPGTLTGGDETWIVGADGSGARRVTDSPDRFQTELDRRPSARFESCCNVFLHGVWVGPSEEDGARCVVGPVGHGGALAWTRSEDRLLFTSRVEYEEEPTLWTVSVAEDEARIVVGPDGRVLEGRGVRGLSGSAAGVLAVRLEVARDSTALWVIRDPSALRVTSPVVSGCEDRFTEIAAFGREQGLQGKLRIRSSFHLPGEDFEVADVYSDSAERGNQVRTALRAGGRVGWIGPPCRIGQFGDRSCPANAEYGGEYLPPSDSSRLWSSRFLQRLHEAHRDRWWVGILLRAPDLPTTAIDSLIGHERFHEALLEDPEVRSRPARLIQIWTSHLPRQPIARAALDAMWPRAAEIVSHPKTPRELLVQLAREVRRRASDEGDAAGIADRLLEDPAAGRDPDVLAHLARLSPSADRAVFRIAGRRLLGHPAATDGAIRTAAPNLAADSALAERLFGDQRILEDAAALRALARTPWGAWTVAERARRKLADLRERRLRRAEGRGHAAPVVLPDRWREAMDLYERYLYSPAVTARSLLERIDPAFRSSSTDSVFLAERRAAERTLCRIVVQPPGEGADAAWQFRDDVDLRSYAEGAVYATSTRLASCLLEAPAAREDPSVLESLSTMVDVNHDPRLPGPDAPGIAEVRRRASELLRELEGA